MQLRDPRGAGEDSVAVGAGVEEARGRGRGDVVDHPVGEDAECDRRAAEQPERDAHAGVEAVEALVGVAASR